MEENESYGLEHIQSVLLQAALKFDEICRANGICYSLHGGTLLGAERNNKFIPWDDDVDVSMKRSEFKKFQLAAKSLPSEFELDDRTMWLPRLVMQIEDGVVCIDIFIWDYISSKKPAQITKITLLRFFQGMIKTHIEYERLGFFNKCLLFLTHIIGKIVPQRMKLKQFNYLCEHSFNGDKKCIHRSNDSFVGMSYILDADYMDGYEDIQFEGHSFMVNKRYREFLIMEYGENYLIPPPMKERKPSHEKFRQSIKRKQKAGTVQ